MEHDAKELAQRQKSYPGSFRGYILGLFLSLLFTFTTYFLTIEHLLSQTMLVYTIVALALLQALAQLVFFLHLGGDSTSHWDLIVFFFMALVTLILVFGSLWIMYSLNGRMMNPMDMDHYMIHQQGI